MNVTTCSDLDHDTFSNSMFNRSSIYVALEICTMLVCKNGTEMLSLYSMFTTEGHDIFHQP